MIDPSRPTLPAATRPPSVTDTPRLRQLADELEAGFLSEMLGHAGFGQASESFGGGIGEEQFGSFLREAQAKAMVKAGGIGLAEGLFRALAATSPGKDTSHAEP